jgi:hypothetical protein
MPRRHQKGQQCKWRELQERRGWGATTQLAPYAYSRTPAIYNGVEAVGAIILVDVINTGPCLPLLTSWGSPRGLKGWLPAGDTLRGADFHLVAGPSSWECSREPQRLFETSGLSDCHQIRYFCLADLLRRESSRSKARRGAAWLCPKEGWPAQHGARARWEVSLVEITLGVHRRPVVPGWQQKTPPNWPWM